MEEGCNRRTERKSKKEMETRRERGRIKERRREVKEG